MTNQLTKNAADATDARAPASMEDRCKANVAAAAAAAAAAADAAAAAER